MRLETFHRCVTVVTADTANGPLGMTVNSFSSVSLDPPLVLWSPAKTSARHDFFIGATNFAIHVLDAEQDALCSRFTRGGLGFEELDWERNSEGVRSFGTVEPLRMCPGLSSRCWSDTRSSSAASFAQPREGDPLCFARGAFGRFTANA